jgi:hypothetical protein
MGNIPARDNSMFYVSEQWNLKEEEIQAKKMMPK